MFNNYFNPKSNTKNHTCLYLAKHCQRVYLNRYSSHHSPFTMLEGDISLIPPAPDTVYLYNNYYYKMCEVIAHLFWFTFSCLLIYLNKISNACWSLVFFPPKHGCSHLLHTSAARCIPSRCTNMTVKSGSHGAIAVVCSHRKLDTVWWSLYRVHQKRQWGHILKSYMTVLVIK